MYLAVDSDELKSLAEVTNDSPTGLVEIVRQNLDPRGDPYMTYKLRWSRWKKERRSAPPYLCFLAVCVLAASDMGRDDSQGISANDYYTRLSERLAIDRARAEADFGTLAEMWISLGEWLERDQGGARGNPMIEEPVWFTNIGWPISQSIFRAVDRYRLPDCFVAAELQPGDQISDEQLFEKVRRWAQPGHRLTARATQMIANATGKIEQQLKEIVSREFAQWDGALRDPTGRKRAVIHLAMFSQAGSTHFEFRPSRPDGFPEVFEPTSPTREPLHSVFDKFYEALPDKVTERALIKGLSLQMPQFSLAFSPQPVIPMAESMEIEGWLSVPRVTADQPYAIIVQGDHLDKVARYLAEAAVGPASTAIRVKSLPSGWALFRNISFKPDARTELPELRCLVPRSDLTSQLIGGLKVSKNAVYLQGCEPRIVLSSAAREVGAVEVDGIRRELDGGSLDLSKLQLEPGMHEIVTGDITRRFETVGSLGEHSMPVRPTVAHRIIMPARKPFEGGASPVSDDVRSKEESRIVGAYCEFSQAPELRPVLVRIGGVRYVALGPRPGEIARFDAGPKPMWLENVVPPKSQRPSDWKDLLDRTRDFDAYLEFEPAWFVRIRGDEQTVLPGNKAAPSTQRRGNDDAVADWSHTIRSLPPPEPTSEAAVWAKYVSVAETALMLA